MIIIVVIITKSFFLRRKSLESEVHPDTFKMHTTFLVFFVLSDKIKWMISNCEEELVLVACRFAVG